MTPPPLKKVLKPSREKDWYTALSPFPTFYSLREKLHPFNHISIVVCKINVTHLAKDLMGIAKSIYHGQPAQSDHGRNFSLLADFLCIE